MDALTFSAVVVACVLGAFAGLAFLWWRRSEASRIQTDQPDINELMRQVRRRPHRDVYVPPRREAVREPALVGESDVAVVPPARPGIGPPSAADEPFPTTGPCEQTAPEATHALPDASPEAGDRLSQNPDARGVGHDDVESEPCGTKDNVEGTAIIGDEPQSSDEDSHVTTQEIESASAGDSEPAQAGDVESPPIAPIGKPVEPRATPARRPRAIHRDRRGRKRHMPEAGNSEASRPPVATSAARTPAELRLRLMLHPIHQTVQLSLMLGKPEGYPERTSINWGGQMALQPFDAKRYDDIDIAWETETLGGELRLESPEGFQWLRSARRVHIFSADATEAGLVSVSSARRAVDHDLICRLVDEEAIRTIADLAGSPTLRRLEHWQGIAKGWCVLRGYRPVRAVGTIAEIDLRPLDPGFDLSIELTGGVALRLNVFAQGHPPVIELPPLPDGVSVTIDTLPAWIGSSGGWEADGWDQPGPHLVDVVPGPSRAYEIAADPADGEGWTLWDAHSGRFNDTGPWARAWICGAAVMGPGKETLVVHEARPALIALGARGGCAALRRRPDADVAMALASFEPAFLFVSSGPRRNQGEVIWLGFGSNSPENLHAAGDLGAWVNTVRHAASRRLPLRFAAGTNGKEAWLSATRRARNLKRKRP